MKKSTTCKKCGLVSFAATDVCKRCGAKLEPLVSAPSQSAALQEPAQDRSRRHTILLVAGCFISFVLGFVAFGSTANYNTPLALGLFCGVFGGGILLSFLVVNFLKSRGAIQRRSPSDRKSWKVILYPLLMFLLLLPVMLLRLSPNVTAEQLSGAIGQLVGSCFLPAIVTGIWINRSKHEWSWLGAGLRYLLFFAVFSILVFLGQHPNR